MSGPLLSVVFPVWNELDSVERAVRTALRTADTLCADGLIGSVEVVLVDDASTDGTSAVIDRMAEADGRVVVRRHEVNRTLGATLRTGFAAASGDVVLYTDADLPFDLMELHKALRLLDQYDADIVSLYRHDRVGEGPRRAIYSYLYNTLVHVVVGLRVRDVNFAGKLMRRSVIDSVHLHSEGSFIDVELLAKAQRQGFRIIQFGVDYFPRSRGVSSLSSAPVIRKMLVEMARIGLEVHREGRRVKVR